jgi:hypothetical protein
MSEKHDLQHDTVDFLHLVSLANEWVHPITGTDATVGILRNDRVRFDAKGAIILDSLSRLTYVIELHFILHQKQCVYLVESFTVVIVKYVGRSSSKKALISGDELLRHHGKIFANERTISKPLKNNTWEIRCPANLEAFLRAYDNLARIHRTFPVFNLPPRQ